MSAIFSTPAECYQVSNVMYAGEISEIPQDKRKGESTHFFRMFTTLGPVYCYYKSEDSAKKARSALGAMMGSLKQELFKSNGNLLDTRKVISYGKVYKLKDTSDGKSHAFPVRLESVKEKNSQIWLTFKSEDEALKTRKALFASIQSINGSKDRKGYKEDSDTIHNEE
jgi:hypothetical protein